MDKDSANKYLVVTGFALIIGVILGIANPNAKYFRFDRDKKIEVTEQEYDEIMVPANPSAYNGNDAYSEMFRGLEYEREEKAKSYQKETNTNFSLLITAFLGALGLGIVGLNMNLSPFSDLEYQLQETAETEST